MLSRRGFLTQSLAIPAVFVAAARPVFAASPETFAEAGVAINGTDPVAYFTEGRPVPGVAAETIEWRGAMWHFSSADNRTAFEMNPEQYAPAYGGYCAWAVARGYLAPTVPEAWKIHEGVLYLNASLRIQRRWERDIPGFIERANANWPGVLG